MPLKRAKPSGHAFGNVGVIGKTPHLRRADPPVVLFLCRQNAAGSIMAEAILNHQAKGRLYAVSVGDAPAGHPGRQTIRLEEAFGTLHHHIGQLLALPLDRLSDQALSRELARIGEALQVAVNLTGHSHHDGRDRGSPALSTERRIAFSTRHFIRAYFLTPCA